MKSVIIILSIFSIITIFIPSVKTNIDNNINQYHQVVNSKKIYYSKEFGVIGDSITDDTKSMQLAHDNVPSGCTLVVVGRIRISEEIQIRKSNLVLDYRQSIIFGSVNPTQFGGLVTIVDRQNPKRVFENIKFIGGFIVPKNEYDNGLGTVQGINNIIFDGQTYDLSNGQRGVALQPVLPMKYTNISFINQRGIGGKKGKNIIHISLVDGAIVKNIKIENIEAKSFINSEAAIHISSCDMFFRIYDLTLKNILLDTVYSGINIKGCKGVVLDSIKIQNIRSSGIILQKCKSVKLNADLNTDIKSIVDAAGGIVSNSDNEDMKISGTIDCNGLAYGLHTASINSEYNVVIKGNYKTSIISTTHTSSNKIKADFEDATGNLLYRKNDTYECYFKRGPIKVKTVDGNNVIGKYNTLPTSGTWIKGDKIYKMTSKYEKVSGWICTVSGTPGIWEKF